MLKCFFYLNLLLIFNTFANDYVVTADEVSNTISFVDAENFKTEGLLVIGPQRNYALKLNTRMQNQVNVHGISFKKDFSKMIVTSNISNSVSIYDLKKFFNIEEYFNVSLTPHVSILNPEEKEIWIATMGSPTLDIYDIEKKTISKLKTDNCPSFVSFNSIYKQAYVSYICSNKLSVFNYETKTKIKDIELNGTTTSFLARSPDNQELWAIRKDSGQVVRIDLNKLQVIEYLDVGNYPQHVAFAEKNGQTVAIVTVGGEGQVQVYNFKTQQSGAKIFGKIDLIGLPHGIAVNTKKKNIIYVGEEHGDKLNKIDLNKMRVIGQTTIGKSPQTVIFLESFDLKKVKNNLVRPEKIFRETKKINLLQKQKVFSNDKMNRSISIAARDYFSEINFYFMIHGKFDKKVEYDLYMSKRSKNKIDKLKALMIGKIICPKGNFVCVSTTSLPPLINYSMMLQNKELDVWAEDESGFVIFKN